MAEKWLEVDTAGLKGPQVGDGLFENRASVAEQLQQTAAAEVSIIVQAFGRLEKTKRCVESVLEHTAGIDYELILMDNGSTDGTLDYFRSVPWEKKTILHITQNIGSGYPSFMLGLKDLGRFVCCLANDNIVTHGWMDGLLYCMKSDPKIGMVVPVTSNVSNFQQVDLPYKTYGEMQREARRFNRSDPSKWEDRLRLITLGALYRKEVLLAIGWPVGDSGFFHDFGDDDVSFAVRQLGYRIVLAGDTWICHDHDFRHGEGKDSAEFERSLKVGRENFQEKYFGVDAWEDVNNYYIHHFRKLTIKKPIGTARILGVDVKCGTPILDMKNRLRKASYFDVELSAFTQSPQYWKDLKTICTGPVICDREEFLLDSFLRENFDYIVADRPINCYHEPQKMLNDLFALCKKGGTVICKLRNTFSFLGYLYLLGQRDVYDNEVSYVIPLEALHSALSKYGRVTHVIAEPFVMPEEQREIIESLIPEGLPEKQTAIDRMLCQNFLLVVEKNA